MALCMQSLPENIWAKTKQKTLCIHTCHCLFTKHISNSPQKRVHFTRRMLLLGQIVIRYNFSQSSPKFFFPTHTLGMYESKCHGSSTREVCIQVQPTNLQSTSRQCRPHQLFLLPSSYFWSCSAKELFPSPVWNFWLTSSRKLTAP